MSMALQRWFKGRARAAFSFWIACAALTGEVQAHSGARADVRVEMAPVTVPGLTVQLHQDYIAPQIVIGNRTGKRLEVRDAQGRPYLRIGPAKADGDVRAEAFHRSRGTAGADLNPKMLSPTPKWQTINQEAAYGWFDPRIATEYLEIPYGIQAIDAPTPFGEWKIDATLDGAPLALRGVFLHVPLPKGALRSRLTSPAEPVRDVQVSVAPSRPPSVFVNNRSAVPIEVPDAKGEAFLRITRDGVWGRPDHPAFAAANPDQRVQGKGWVKLNAGSSHAWLDARANTPAKPARDQKPGPLGSWSLTLRHGAQPLVLRGVSEWVLNPQLRNPPRPEARR